MRKLTQLLALAATIGIAAPATHAFHEFNYKFDVALDGSQNVAGGDPDGSGMAEIVIDAFNGHIWWDIVVNDIAPVTIDHIHEAPAGATGPVVVDFMGMLSGWSSIDVGLAQDIVTNYDQYYVNIHNEEYPAGAIRGQLSAPMEVAKQVPDSMSSSLVLLAIGSLIAARRFRGKKAAA